MKKSFWLMTAVVLLAFTACKSGRNARQAGQDGLQGEVNISGAFALYPMTLLWADEFQKQHPGVEINVSGGGAGKGMTDALNNMVDFGMISREIKPAEIEKGAWFIAVARDAVVPTINPKNPVCPEVLKRGLTREQLEKIFITGEITHWNQLYPDMPGSETAKISVYTRSDACGAAETFAEYFGKHQEDLRGIGVNGDPGMAAAVQKDIYGIGYNNLGFGYDLQTRKPVEGLGILPLDIDGNGKLDSIEDFYADVDRFSNAIKQNIYPAPPARNLYLACKGIPENPAARAFLTYILSEGQALATIGGYVALPEAILSVQLQKLQAGAPAEKQDGKTDHPDTHAASPEKAD